MELATTVVGTGSRTVALVHGINATGELWHDFAELLAGRYGFRVLAVDLRGHGESGRAESYRVADFAEDLVETLLSRLDLVIGHSLGGRILAEAVPRLRPGRAIYLDPAFALAGGALGRGALRRMPGLRPLVGFVFSRGTPGVTPENRERFRRSTERWDTRMIRELVVDLAERPLPMGPPAVPSTVLRAPRSGLVSRRLASALAADDWDVRDVPGAVHDMATLDPGGTADLLDDLLRAGS